MVEAKPLNDKELKYLIELQSEIPEQMKSETVDRLLNTIAGLCDIIATIKAENARLRKAIEPFEWVVKVYAKYSDNYILIPTEGRASFPLRDLRNLIAATKEGDDAE
jgi:hypothetical protein